MIRNKPVKWIVFITLYKPTKLFVGNQFKKVQSFTQLFQFKSHALTFGKGFKDHAGVVVLPIDSCKTAITNFEAAIEIKDALSVELVMED